MINEKDLKREIREMKKIKRDCKMKSPLRRKLNKQIRILKEQLNTLYKSNPEKVELIRKVLEAKPELKKLKINHFKFTVVELQKYLDKLNEKREIIYKGKKLILERDWEGRLKLTKKGR
jgi:hypothetical protein